MMYNVACTPRDGPKSIRYLSTCLLCSHMYKVKYSGVKCTHSPLSILPSTYAGLEQTSHLPTHANHPQITRSNLDLHALLSGLAWVTASLISNHMDSPV